MSRSWTRPPGGAAPGPRAAARSPLLSPPSVLAVLTVLAVLGVLLSLLLSSPAPAWSAPAVAPPSPGGLGLVAPAQPSGVWPLQPRPRVARYFDPPDVLWGAGHRGVDLAGRVGQPVHAALAGTVVFAGRIAGRGVIVVTHGALRTTYEPVTATARVGEQVRTGQVVGRLEWFGSHCLPHACLHWGLKDAERYLDPLTLVGGPKPVRLLPLGPVVLTPMPVA